MASVVFKDEPVESVAGDDEAHFKLEKALAQANTAKAEGNQLFVAGQFEDALSKYELALYFALEIPSCLELRSICHSNRAVCFSKQGKYEEAIKEATKALDLNAKNLKALIRRGEAHEKLNHFNESISDMKRILELDPLNNQARETIWRLESLASEKRAKIKEELIESENMYQPQHHTSLDPMMMEFNGYEDISVLGNEPMQKKSRLTSAVWKDFDRVVMGGIKVAICKHCNRRMSASSTAGTSHLRKHLIRCMRLHTLDGSQQTPEIKEDCGNAEVETFEFDVTRSRNDFAQMVIFHELPFDLASFVGLKKFLKNLQPLFPLEGPKVLETDCIKVYEDEKVKMYEKLANVGSRISLTSELWITSTQDRGYMALTAYYVDEDWVLQKRELNFIQVDMPQNTKKLSESIMWCLLEWSIDGKLFSLSLDNCLITDCVAKTICQQLNARRVLLGNGKFFHVCCGANILNLIIQQGWKALGVCSVLNKVRESVKYVTNSTKKFSAIVNIIGVNTTRSLFLDSPTQRNSTYEMLEVAFEYRNAFSYLERHDQDFKIVFTSKEWDLVKDVTDRVKTLHDATNLFSGTKYPTASLFFHQICEISLAISKWEVSQDPFICKAGCEMRSKFIDYWGACHSGLAIASIIDPQYKCLLLQYYFPLFYGKDTAQKLVEETKKSFENLYNEYASKTTSNQGDEAQSNGDVYMELSGFDRFIQQTSRSYVKKRDLEYYLEEAVLPRSKDFDILGWWKANEEKYPVLSKMARDILGIPVLSTGGKVLDEYRSSLSAETTQALICGKDWLRDEFKDWKQKVDIPELLMENGVDLGYSD